MQEQRLCDLLIVYYTTVKKKRPFPFFPFIRFEMGKITEIPLSAAKIPSYFR